MGYNTAFCTRHIIWANILCLWFSAMAYAQNNYIDSSFYHSGIAGILDEVVIIGYKDDISHEDSLRIRRRVFKVWPYAVLAAENLQEIDQIRQEVSRREFRHTVQERQKMLFAEFEDILKKFSRSEGRVLIKLIYRLTGISVYDIARDLKSGWRAFWWNSAAGMFSLSLKAEYSPSNIAEDRVIEHFLKEYIDKGLLFYYPAHWESISYFYSPAGKTSSQMQILEQKSTRKKERKSHKKPRQ